MSKIITQDDAIKRSNDVGVQLIDTYINVKTPINFKCPVCSQIWTTSPSGVWGKGAKTCGRCNNPKIGEVFGDLTISKVIPSKMRSSTVEAVCSCGRIWTGKGFSLQNGGTKTCGHCRDPKTGDKFGKLVITKVIPSCNKGCNVIALCECGNKWNGTASQLTRQDNRKIQSCGHCKDLSIGDIFGSLKVIKIIPNSSNSCGIKVKCNCGNTLYTRKGNLQNGSSKSCGHCKDPNIGDKFGLLTITKVIPYRSSGCSIESICECGGTWSGVFNRLSSGITKSCGCLRSLGENTIQNWLIKHNIKYEPQKKFLGCKYKLSLPFDFYIPHKNMCIEYQGEQHYRPVNFNGISNEQADKVFYSTMRSDMIKQLYCQNNHLTYMEIPYWKLEDIDQVLQRILL